MTQVENILKKDRDYSRYQAGRRPACRPPAKALLSEALGATEITFRTPAAASSIQAIAEQVPDMFVCAGTVLNTEQAVGRPPALLL